MTWRLPSSFSGWKSRLVPDIVSEYWETCDIDVRVAVLTFWGQ